jgi:hypothetical protein
LLAYHDPKTKTALYQRLSFACIRLGLATPQREAGMATNVNVMFRDVHQPRHISAMVTALDKTDKFVSDAVITVYTGTLGATLASERAWGADPFHVEAFVPMNLDDPSNVRVDNPVLVEYRERIEFIDGVAHATACTFAEDPTLVAVDRFSIDLKKMRFIDGQERNVLILAVDLKVHQGTINGIAYQVTTLSRFPLVSETPGTPPNKLQFSTFKPDPPDHPNRA